MELKWLLENNSEENEVTFSVYSVTFVSSISDGGEFQHPCDIAVDYKRDDRLIVTDFNNNRVQVREGTYTAKHAQLATNLLTSCNRLVINKPISECVRMANCDSLLTTNLLKVVDRLVFKTCYPQACCKLFQQVVTSLQMTSCNKPVFNRLVTTWWNWQVWCNLLTSFNKSVKLITCSKSEAVWAWPVSYVAPAFL